jgi:hypothetical protein
VSAGAPVVASATSTHREIAAYLEEAAVVLVTPTGSPLEVADAISRVAGLRIRSTQAELPTWDAVVERTLDLYRLVGGDGAKPRPDGWPVLESVEKAGSDAQFALER